MKHLRDTQVTGGTVIHRLDVPWFSALAHLAVEIIKRLRGVGLRVEIGDDPSGQVHLHAHRLALLERGSPEKPDLIQEPREGENESNRDRNLALREEGLAASPLLNR